MPARAHLPARSPARACSRCRQFDEAFDTILEKHAGSVGDEKYSVLYQQYRKRIDKMFMKLDRDASGSVEMRELADLVNLVSPPFVKADYLAWYDSNGSVRIPGSHCPAFCRRHTRPPSSLTPASRPE